MATEKRLIDANALKIHRMHNTGDNHPLDVAYRKDIDNAPTVDAVEVVRCKECAYSTGKVKPCPLYRDGLMKDDDYCSVARRKADG